jgi:hypothetical protein
MISQVSNGLRRKQDRSRNRIVLRANAFSELVWSAAVCAAAQDDNGGD